jgi:hypothetical protein
MGYHKTRGSPAAYNAALTNVRATMLTYAANAAVPGSE